MRRIIIVLTFLLLIIVLTINSFDNQKEKYIKQNYLKDKLNYNILSINKIDLIEIVKYESIDSKNIMQVVMFKDFGKPNVKNTNTILAAHSGSGNKAKFKNLDKLSLNDKAKFYYNGVEYNYKVIEKFLVHEKDFTILNNILEKTTLTLMTCDTKNDDYRLIVVLELIDFN